MGYLIMFVLGSFLGAKFNKALTLWRDSRNVKFIKETVTQLLGEEEIKLVDFNASKRTKQMDLDDKKEDAQLYKEYLKFKQMKLHSEGEN